VTVEDIPMDARLVEQRAEALGAFWREEVLGNWPGFDFFVKLVKAGWGHGSLGWLIDMGRMADAGWRGRPQYGTNTVILGRSSHAFDAAHWQVREIVPWLEVLAGTPDKAEFRRLHPARPVLDETVSLSDRALRWREALPEVSGPLAEAAGFPIEDLLARRDAGAGLPSRGELRLLAVLRGYRFLDDSHC
jgi:hypothetical protein